MKPQNLTTILFMLTTNILETSFPVSDKTTSKAEPSITSKKNTEIILAKLKEERRIEEEQNKINAFSLKLTLFTTIGLVLIYFFVFKI